MCVANKNSQCAGYYDILLRTACVQTKIAPRIMALHYRTSSPSPLPARALNMSDGHHLIIVYDSDTSISATWVRMASVFCLPVCLCAAPDMSLGLFAREFNANGARSIWL